MKKYLIGTAAALLTAGLPIAAQAGDDVSVSVTTDYVSEYVFRGVSFARGAVQPGIEVSKGDFTVGVWTSAAIGEASDAAADEIDVYASYGFALSDTVSASVGATIYHFPDTPGSLFDFGDASSLELNAGVSFDEVAFAPAITAYYDLDLEAFTLEAGVGHSVPLQDKTSLDFGLTAGLVESDGFDYQYGQASASVGYAFTDDVSAYVGANYALSSEDTLNFKVDGNGDSFTNSGDKLWFGVGFGAGF